MCVWLPLKTVLTLMCTVLTLTLCCFQNKIHKFDHLGETSDRCAWVWRYIYGLTILKNMNWSPFSPCVWYCFKRRHCPQLMSSIQASSNVKPTHLICVPGLVLNTVWKLCPPGAWHSSCLSRLTASLVWWDIYIRGNHSKICEWLLRSIDEEKIGCLVTNL